MKNFILLLTFFPFIISVAQTKSFVAMPSMFSDNMVLQQKADVPVWGMASPGTSIIVKASWGASAKTKVSSDSLWKVKLKTPKAGEPFVLNIIIGDTTIAYKNVMLGEVWFCSGQSNMEIPLEGWPPENPIQNSAQEIKEANYPNIRLFTVARAYSDKPEFNCTGKWSECNPQTAAKFSAAAYFFGRKLFKELNVPIGLIFSSWGGTKIQPWISGKYLQQMPEYKSIVAQMAQVSGEVKKINGWIYRHPVIDISAKDPVNKWENLEFGDSLCPKPDFDDSNWRTMKLPVYWESTEVGDFDGVVWFRKKIEIPKTWLNQDLVLELGPVDDMDRSYVNGVEVGANEQAGFWQTPRIYNVPKEIVNDTVLTLAVRALDNGGGGGIWGNNVKMQILLKDSTVRSKTSEENISIAGDWKYLPVAEYINEKFYVYKIEGEEFDSRPKSTLSFGPNTPTMLYNGMIAPVIPYYIKGVLWYQGESNSDLPDDYNNYKYLFPLLIKNWRANWGERNIPFYYAQIAPWSYGESSKSYMIRDAQRLTLSVPNTGMAVLLDIGSVTTIHPSDKQDVGERLALWALAKNYHKKILYSGPLYKSIKIEKNRIVISFNYAGKGLVLKPQQGLSNFMIAGADKKFVPAEAKVEGTRLIVFSNIIDKPVAVRYGWTNWVDGNLFNKEGLPASSFRTDDWSNF
ncbi:MAG: sialate O-acetylesterase [Ignavibacteriaceae bacterium]